MTLINPQLICRKVVRRRAPTAEDLHTTFVCSLCRPGAASTFSTLEDFEHHARTSPAHLDALATTTEQQWRERNSNAFAATFVATMYQFFPSEASPTSGGGVRAEAVHARHVDCALYPRLHETVWTSLHDAVRNIPALDVVATTTTSGCEVLCVRAAQPQQQPQLESPQLQTGTATRREHSSSILCTSTSREPLRVDIALQQEQSAPLKKRQRDDAPPPSSSGDCFVFEDKNGDESASESRPLAYPTSSRQALGFASIVATVPAPSSPLRSTAAKEQCSHSQRLTSVAAGTRVRLATTVNGVAIDGVVHTDVVVSPIDRHQYVAIANLQTGGIAVVPHERCNFYLTPK